MGGSSHSGTCRTPLGRASLLLFVILATEGMAVLGGTPNEQKKADRLREHFERVQSRNPNLRAGGNPRTCNTDLATGTKTGATTGTTGTKVQYNGRRSLQGTASIRVFWHSILSMVAPPDDYEGNITRAVAQYAVTHLNTAFNPYGFYFTFAGYDATVNYDWFYPDSYEEDYSNYLQMTNQLRTATGSRAASDLHVYTYDMYGDYGQAVWPWDAKTFGKSDGIALWDYTVPVYNTDIYGDIIEGDDLVHYVGHWLGLFHPYSGGCGAGNSYSSDRVIDTPPEAYSGYLCDTPRDTCPGDGLFDLLQNFMDLSVDLCRNSFTAGQAVRMTQQFTAYRYNKNVW